eukprot:6198932-Pleurochrysis_carterae.AAC.2
MTDNLKTSDRQAGVFRSLAVARLGDDAAETYARRKNFGSAKALSRTDSQQVLDKLGKSIIQIIQ